MTIFIKKSVIIFVIELNFEISVFSYQFLVSEQTLQELQLATSLLTLSTLRGKKGAVRFLFAVFAFSILHEYQEKSRNYL